MKQIIDRVAITVIGLLFLMLIEGIASLGQAFVLENYNTMGLIAQGMVVFVVIWLSNKAYDHED
jgi:hypothetical protein